MSLPADLLREEAASLVRAVAYDEAVRICQPSTRASLGDGTLMPLEAVRQWLRGCGDDAEHSHKESALSTNREKAAQAVAGSSAPDEASSEPGKTGATADVGTAGISARVTTTCDGLEARCFVLAAAIGARLVEAQLSRDQTVPVFELLLDTTDHGTQAVQWLCNELCTGTSEWAGSTEWLRQWAESQGSLTIADRSKDLETDDVVAAVSRWFEWTSDPNCPTAFAARRLADEVDWDMLRLSRPARIAVELYRDCGPPTSRAALHATYELGRLPPEFLFESIVPTCVQELCTARTELAARRLLAWKPLAVTGNVLPTLGARPSFLEAVGPENCVQWSQTLQSMPPEARVAVARELADVVSSSPDRFVPRACVVWTLLVEVYLHIATMESDGGDELRAFSLQWTGLLEGHGRVAALLRRAAVASGQINSSSFHRLDPAGTLRQSIVNSLQD